MILLNAYDWTSIFTFGCIFAVVGLIGLLVRFIPNDSRDDNDFHPTFSPTL